MNGSFSETFLIHKQIIINSLKRKKKQNLWTTFIRQVLVYATLALDAAAVRPIISAGSTSPDAVYMYISRTATYCRIYICWGRFAANLKFSRPKQFYGRMTAIRISRWPYGRRTVASNRIGSCASGILLLLQKRKALTIQTVGNLWQMITYMYTLTYDKVI